MKALWKRTVFIDVQDAIYMGGLICLLHGPGLSLAAKEKCHNIMGCGASCNWWCTNTWQCKATTWHCTKACVTEASPTVSRNAFQNKLAKRCSYLFNWLQRLAFPDALILIVNRPCRQALQMPGHALVCLWQLKTNIVMSGQQILNAENCYFLMDKCHIN